MKKITLLFFMFSLFSLSAKTISINNADCKENKSQIVLQKKLGFQPKAIYRGQIRVGELIKIYSSAGCSKIGKQLSFSCSVGDSVKEMEKEGLVTYKMYTGTCF